MKVVHRAESEVEAVMLQGVLEGAGIPVILRGRERDKLIYGNAAELLWGWGELLVPDDRAEEAQDLIAEYLRSLREESSP